MESTTHNHETTSVPSQIANPMTLPCFGMQSGPFHWNLSVPRFHPSPSFVLQPFAYPPRHTFAYPLPTHPPTLTSVFNPSFEFAPLSSNQETTSNTASKFSSNQETAANTTAEKLRNVSPANLALLNAEKGMSRYNPNMLYHPYRVESQTPSIGPYSRPVLQPYTLQPIRSARHFVARDLVAKRVQTDRIRRSKIARHIDELRIRLYNHGYDASSSDQAAVLEYTLILLKKLEANPSSIASNHKLRSDPASPSAFQPFNQAATSNSET